MEGRVFKLRGLETYQGNDKALWIWRSPCWLQGERRLDGERWLVLATAISR